ncbi:hypothetical protein NEOLEDRAFT_1210327 [Neolentinus lepideus HHB14362 ss-1]|uniref:hAT-like transposase RNase-H fold domain-containing protein n=1 Tax=Neolentinus lepideus HHB14362 ss-1 TaxID=1314782 RepID=A0A165RNC6_9AGAM|nr:hypothetical protein NEOLEDRAFT_1210327 [Neolentinus lepideus HHB14362 ss-1]
MAHIINLATQALIKAHTSGTYYDPHDPDACIPSTPLGTANRDEVALVRAIAVKERSSAKRKERFRKIQALKSITRLLQLILDIATRWSSTYLMLRRALHLRDHVDTFVYEIGRDERNLEKRAKIDDLKLTAEEWKRVSVFEELLKCADLAQQAFSSEHGPSLHLALPALEALRKGWQIRKDRGGKYSPFISALRSGITKINEYYMRTVKSEAYVMSMGTCNGVFVLDPAQKALHFDKYWTADDKKEAMELIEAKVSLLCFSSSS